MIVAFEDKELDFQVAELRGSGKAIAIEPRAFDLLCLLIAHRDRLVSRDEIVREVWNGRYISDAAISTCIKSLRKALGDDGDQQRLIRTVRGRGFRFVGAVTESGTDSGTGQAGEPALDQAAAASIPAAPKEPAPVAELPREDGGKPSLVVLPFENFGSDRARTLFADAIPHDLIQGLAKLRWLRVIARGTAFQFRGPDLDLAAIGKRLGVRYALTGTVLHFQDMMSVTVELVECDSGLVIWAERYEDKADRFLEIRREMLDQIASSLELYITQREASIAARATTHSLDAWAEYHLGLRHLFLFNADNNRLAKTCFERAAEKDPDFARALAGLSFARFQDAFLGFSSDTAEAVSDARSFAERAVELDPLDPFANLNLGRSFWLIGEPGAGLGWLERSLSLSPNFAQGHYSRAFAAAMEGQADAALNHASSAIDLSPLDPMLYAMHGVRAVAQLRAGDLDAAATESAASVHAPGAHHLIFMIAAATHALAGDLAAAGRYAARARASGADTGLENFFRAFPFAEKDLREAFRRGLSLAGLG